MILRSHILDFEARIERAVAAFAHRLPDSARVLDAGAGECRYSSYFSRHLYTGVDLAVGDSSWNYSRLDAVADLERLPFRDGAFSAVINIVTLEHVRRPLDVLRELARVLPPEGRLLLVTPHEWEEHQQPHDFFRFTRYGLTYLLSEAGFVIESLEAAGGFFRLLSRRLLNAYQFFPWPLKPVAALLLGPPGLLLPVLDPLDKRRNFTLGHICVARKR